MGCGISTQQQTRAPPVPAQITAEKTVGEKLSHLFDMHLRLSGHPALASVITQEGELMTATLNLGRKERQTVEEWGAWFADTQDNKDAKHREKLHEITEEMRHIAVRDAAATSSLIGMSHFFIKGMNRIENFLVGYDKLTVKVTEQQKLVQVCEQKKHVIEQASHPHADKLNHADAELAAAHELLKKAEEKQAYGLELVKQEKGYWLKVYLFAREHARHKALQAHMENSQARIATIMKMEGPDKVKIVQEVRDLIMINGVQCGDGWPLELQEASAYQYLDTLSEQIADDYKKDAASKENALLDSIGDDSSHDSELIAKLQADLLQARQELRAQQEAKAHEQLLKVSEHLGEQKQQEILRLHEESMKAQDKQMEESSAAQMQELQARIAAKRAARKNVTSQ